MEDAALRVINEDVGDVRRPLGVAREVADILEVEEIERIRQRIGELMNRLLF